MHYLLRLPSLRGLPPQNGHDMAHMRQLTGLLPQPVRFGLRRIAYRGSAQMCVLCRSTVRGFIAHGGGAEVLDRRRVVGGMRRIDDRCPVCHGCDRTRLLMLYLMKEAAVGRRPIRLLHVAPDFGLYLWLRRQDRLTYVGSDIDASRYRHIENMHTVDLTDVPFEDDSFDVIVCSHVLEHVPDDTAAMAELFRILRPGGQALVLVPLALDGAGTDEDRAVRDPRERLLRFGQWDHVRIYNRSDYFSRLQDVGFATVAFDPFEQYPDEADALHLNPLEVLPVGRKSGA